MTSATPPGFFPPETEDPHRPWNLWLSLQVAWLSLCQWILRVISRTWWEAMPPEDRDAFRDSPRKDRPKQSAQARVLLTELGT
jgi:hypothetical protein